MLRRSATGLAIASALAIAVPATAASYIFPVNIRDETLAMSLSSLARQTGIELIFDRSLLGSRKAPGLQGRLPVDLALQRLLSGTDLSARRATSGAWIIERRAPSGKPASPDLAAPEILVVGRRAQDADIRRRENDIQPYQVSTGEEVVQSHRDNLDQFFQSRISSDTTTAPPSLGQTGDTNSSIDLRGLGANETLVLVDGRRLPGIPSGIGFGQPDINAIPLHAIDRIETLTGTAGGIYGLGALGGVVNVVLRHDYHGLEVHATTGINSRGDARRLSLEGGIGFTPDGGKTDISIYVSHSWQQPLLEGQSNLYLRGIDEHDRFAPSDYAIGGVRSNSVLVASAAGDDLVLKPTYGGGSLGSAYSFGPKGFAGSQAALAALLAGNAGQVDLSPFSNERAADVDSAPITTSAIADVRHRFGAGLEAYFDALILRNRGRFRDPETGAEITLSPDSSLNPFQGPINLIFEGPAANNISKAGYSSNRYTLGLIASLPFGWRVNPEATFGSAGYSTKFAAYVYDSFEFTGVDCPNVNPFGDQQVLQSSLAACRHSYLSSEVSHTRYREQSLRLAGPLFRTSAGSATLAVELQNRQETAAPSKGEDIYDSSDPEPFEYGGDSSRTRSIYSELAAPLIRQDANIPFLKGLALQLAVRRDWLRIAYPGDSGELHPSFSGTMYTVGTKFFPLPWLMLRGSYATGQQPPPVENLEETDYSSYIAELDDPKRGGVQPFSEDQYLEKTGELSPRNVFASTLALGLVINPSGDGSPRLSIDYSHTRENGIYADPELDLILANEIMYPDRVTRAPLTDADRAKGYTGGVIEVIDTRGLSTARVNARSVDMRLDWHVPFAGGILRAHGSLTRQLQNRVTGPAVEPVDYAGFVDGPLLWRANGGAEWTRARTTIGWNLQYFGRYRIVPAELPPSLAFVSEDAQGSSYVKAQAYLDLHMSRRFHTYWGGAHHEMSVDLGVINLLNHTPPYQELNDGPQFSLYGDPRERRFELTLNTTI